MESSEKGYMYIVAQSMRIQTSQKESYHLDKQVIILLQFRRETNTNR
jgi:hypothetical protein